MIRLLTVDDSKVIAELLRHIFEQEDGIEVIGHAFDGNEAVDLTLSLKPDIISMDIQMPNMDGLQAIREIMHRQPTPIIVVSSYTDDQESKTSFKALEEGAISVLAKPVGPHFDKTKKDIVDTIRTMAGTKVMMRNKHINKLLTKKTALNQNSHSNSCYELIAIGVSTGGPQTLAKLLSGIPRDLPIPITVVQHMSVGFLGAMLNWLKNISNLRLVIAKNGQQLEPGTVYFAADEMHMVVRKNRNKLEARLIDGLEIDHFIPSANELFSSVAQACQANAIGIVLTGMGDDGANGLLKMKQAGALTIAQTPESCTIDSMPLAAISSNAADMVIGISDLSNYLVNKVAQNRAQQATHKTMSS